MKKSELYNIIKQQVYEYTGTGASGGNSTDGNDIASPRPFPDDKSEIQNYIKKRLKLHNLSRGAKFTRGRKWKLIYKEKFNTKKEAISREYYIKKNRSLRNKIKLKNL